MEAGETPKACGLANLLDHMTMSKRHWPEEMAQYSGTLVAAIEEDLIGYPHPQTAVHNHL